MSMPDDLPLQPGDVLRGKYRIVRVIGAGGMGAVLEAQHLVLDQRVAIKLVLPEAAKRDASVQRFLREARAASSLRSEHVARVLDVDTLDGGLPYLVMDLLEGSDLSARLKAEGPLPIDEACEMGVQICEGLSEAHARGIVHRDIKPGNLFVVRRADGSPLVKVLDFGIAKLVAPADEISADSLTSQNALVGSPLYMSPEQMRSPRAVDTRSDIWSLGVALYQALSGRLPFEAETFGELILLVTQDPPAPLSSRRAGLPEALSGSIMRCLERRPEDRWQDVAQLAAALAPFAPARCRPLVERAQATLAASGRGSLPSAPHGQAPAAAPAGAAGSLPMSTTVPAPEAARPASTSATATTVPAATIAGAPAADPGPPAGSRRAIEPAAAPRSTRAPAPTLAQTAEPWSGSHPPAPRARPRWLRLAGGASALAGLAAAALLLAERREPAAAAGDAPVAATSLPAALGAPAAPSRLPASEPLPAQPAPEPLQPLPAPEPREAPRASEPLPTRRAPAAAPAAEPAAPTASAAAPAGSPAGRVAAATPPPRGAPSPVRAPQPDARAAAPGPAAPAAAPGPAASASARGAPQDALVPNYGPRK
ncbi:protein kinase domain-containing protein [Sorangium sp. So ce854]|uniref:serine/threonine-protein kinase n=1 Tax=Sorangium sp. So ce854 TaxID=3133322 RepID=UPI003F63A46E